jgi:hypothetical protein
MADGLGDTVGGLLGLAIVANVASNMAGGGRRTRTVTRTKTVYKARPKISIKPKRRAKTVTTTVTTSGPKGLFGGW